MTNKTLKITDLISLLESQIENPNKGLPEDVFLFISRNHPMTNVDLLIKNEKNQTLLTWREKGDNYWPPGWHIPGGIIRYSESIATRINAVAMNELGVTIKFKNKPIAINEIILPERRNRSHFISLLFECKLNSQLDKKQAYKKGPPEVGQWAWHDNCPANIISAHHIYRKYIG